MTAIWSHDGEAWRLVAPSGFPAEEALHDLVEQARNMLPLSGNPQLTIVGREVFLGGNKADLIAVEPSGRLAIIEIKLRDNAEARRAVIAQILTYAAFLRGLPVESVERDVLGVHLRRQGFADLASAVLANDQSDAFDAIEFGQELSATLAEGRFRLVLVLDDAPAELVQLVGYLEAVADKLVIDLITVSAYEIGGRRVMVPQRVEPERILVAPPGRPGRPAGAGQTPATLVWDTAPFEESIATVPPDEQQRLLRLLQWARDLEREGLAKLGSVIGKGRWLLKVIVPDEPQPVGLVTIYNERGASMNFHRTVMDRRAPSSVAEIEAAAAPTKVGQGTNTTAITDELLAAITRAYREASGRLSSATVDHVSG